MTGVLQTAASVDRDKAWEAQAAPRLMQALQDTFGGTFSKGTRQEDLHSGTDYYWHRKAHDLRLACRVRRPEFIKYRHDFTIREDRPQTGNATELQKIRAGHWADLYIYGFCTETTVLAWSLFRMKHFDENAPFHYMPGFAPLQGATPGNNRDTVTRLYSSLSQPPCFLITTSEKHAMQKRTAA